MRVTCPCGCKRSFDVPIRTVLAEAEKIKNKIPPTVESKGEEPNGNVLLPSDLQAKRQRQEAIRRRMGSEIL